MTFIGSSRFGPPVMVDHLFWGASSSSMTAGPWDTPTGMPCSTR